MTRRMLMLTAAAVLAMSWTSFGAELFSDNFSKGSDAWKLLNTGAVYSMSTKDSTFTVTTTAGLALFKHDTVFTNFTYTVVMSSLHATYSNVGIFFCMGDALGGYVVTLDNLQRFNLMKVPVNSGSLVTLATLPNSHINVGTNVITVNHYNNQITLLCNGWYLTTVTDATFPSGKIGFMVGAGENAAFDNVVVSDVAAVGKTGGCFNDNFDDGNLTDWYVAPFGDSAKALGGAMRLFSDASHRNGTTVFYSGDYDSSSVQFVVSKVAGNDSADYGLSFLNVSPFSSTQYTVTGTSLFAMNAVGQYGLKAPDSTTYYLKSKLETPFHGKAGKDTLKVVRRPAFYVFYANGRALDSVPIPATYKSNSIGLFVSSGVTVDFDDVSAALGDSPNCPVTRNLAAGRRLLTTAQRPAYIFDLAGRRMTGAIGADVKSLVPGRYFMFNGGDAGTRILPVK